ncbi:YaaA family protein [Romboutsia sp.]|uniref:YaaA family protein n=1 Tax=Romboutsia sp. TaxID=1965302 RepID=UPI003F2A22F8
MLTIISPTTTMNFDKNININNESLPVFDKEIKYLIHLLKSLSKEELSTLMNLSDDLTNLNYERHSNLLSNDNPKLQSILAFDGEVFSCMKADEFIDSDFEFVNNHLRIISGLYGVLKPLDLIEPYRLEMKSKLQNQCGNDLYKFWKSKVTDNLINELKNHNNKVLINLASSEYLKCIDLKILKKEYNFIDIAFKEYNPTKDVYQTKGLYAKRARGYMVNYIVKNKIDNISDLKSFNVEGYKFNTDLSDYENYVFSR